MSKSDIYYNYLQSEKFVPENQFTVSQSFQGAS